MLGPKQTGAVKERMEGREGEVVDGCHSSPKATGEGKRDGAGRWANKIKAGGQGH